MAPSDKENIFYNMYTVYPQSVNKNLSTAFVFQTYRMSSQRHIVYFFILVSNAANTYYLVVYQNICTAIVSLSLFQCL
jgi:hypothetical protein